MDTARRHIDGSISERNGWEQAPCHVDSLGGYRGISGHLHCHLQLDRGSDPTSYGIGISLGASAQHPFRHQHRWTHRTPFYSQDNVEKTARQPWSASTSQPSPQDLERIYAKYTTAIIISLALCESVGIYGLILFFLGGSFQTMYTFMIISAAGMFYYRPKREEIEALSRTYWFTEKHPRHVLILARFTEPKDRLTRPINADA